MSFGIHITPEEILITGLTIVTPNGETIPITNTSGIPMNITGNGFFSEQYMRERYRAALPRWKRWLLR